MISLFPDPRSAQAAGFLVWRGPETTSGAVTLSTAHVPEVPRAPLVISSVQGTDTVQHPKAVPGAATHRTSGTEVAMSIFRQSPMTPASAPPRTRVDFTEPLPFFHHEESERVLYVTQGASPSPLVFSIALKDVVRHELIARSAVLTSATHPFGRATGVSSLVETPVRRGLAEAEVFHEPGFCWTPRAVARLL